MLFLTVGLFTLFFTTLDQNDSFQFKKKKNLKVNTNILVLLFHV